MSETEYNTKLNEMQKGLNEAQYQYNRKAEAFSKTAGMPSAPPMQPTQVAPYSPFGAVQGGQSGGAVGYVPFYPPPPAPTVATAPNAQQLQDIRNKAADAARRKNVPPAERQAFINSYIRIYKQRKGIQ